MGLALSTRRRLGLIQKKIKNKPKPKSEIKKLKKNYEQENRLFTI